MQGIAHVILLAAGAGSRLRAAGPVKPLVKVGGRPLLLRALDAAAAAGIGSATVVLGHAAAEVRASLADAPLPTTTVVNPGWAESANGTSLLAAADAVGEGALLLMADHLLGPALIARLIEGAGRRSALAVDRRLGHPWVDVADVTRVRTRGGAIEAIGKELLVYDAHDTGAFVVRPDLIAALGRLPDPSLSAGVAALGTVAAVDIGDAPWLDVDDPRALALAEAQWPG